MGRHKFSAAQDFKSSAAMGAPMSSTKPVDNPADAFLQPDDPVGISFWIISIAMIASTVFFFAESGTVTSHWKTSLHVGGLVTLVAGVHYMYMRECWVLEALDRHRCDAPVRILRRDLPPSSVAWLHW